MDMSSMLEKEREEMRAKFLADAEAERQRIREELQAKLRMELEESVRCPHASRLPPLPPFPSPVHLPSSISRGPPPLPVPCV
jgi:hypothetical protein